MESLTVKLVEHLDNGAEKHRIGVGKFIPVGKFAGEDDASLLEIADRLREDLEMAFSKLPAVSVVTRERLADLQSEWNLQERDILDPGSRVPNASLKGVDGIVRGKFFPAPKGIEVYAELVFVKGGDVRKEKVTLPLTRFGRQTASAPSPEMREAEIASRARAMAERMAKEKGTLGTRTQIPDGPSAEPSQQKRLITEVSGLDNFFRAFVNSWISNNPADEASFYADFVDWEYIKSHMASRAEIRSLIGARITRYPKRNYSNVSMDQPSVDDKGRVHAKYRYDYVYSGVKLARGSSESRMVLQRFGDRWQIISWSEKVKRLQ